jgi:hypothetical protein
MPGRYEGNVNHDTPQALVARGAIRNTDLNSREELYLRGYNKGQTITCNAGMVWFTQEGDSKDYILKPGDSVQITGSGRSAVRALQDARISFYAAPKQASLWSRVRRAFMPKAECDPVCHHA